MTVYENNFVSFALKEDLKLLTVQWEKNEDVDQEVFYREMTALAEHTEKHKPTYLLMDSTQLMYSLNPENQEWLIRQIIPRLNPAGVRKIAWVNPGERISKRSENQELHELDWRFFNRVADAEAWLVPPPVSDN
ncbi:MAG: hypothetical protein HC880_05980 [Bacteroidia bacterium]|nr:hypothetical protein [Bacteroidia bacterium]